MQLEYFSHSLAQDNLSAVLYGAGDLPMEQTPIEEPGEEEVQINVRTTGICGSDLHYYHQGRIGTRVLNSSKPMILGHESFGIVTKGGSNVRQLSVGDRVVIEPRRACHQCDRCQEGRYNLFPSMKFSASLLQGPNNGWLLQEYVCFPAYLCHKSFDRTFSSSVHAVGGTPTVKRGSCVAIIGAGPIGLLVAAAAYAQQAEKYIIFDINTSRLAFAKSYLSKIETVVVPRKANDDGLSALEWAQQQAIVVQGRTMVEETIDAVFECTRIETNVGLSMYLVRRGGVVMLIGMGTSQCMMSIDLVSTREIDVLGNFRYSNVHPKAIEMVSQGKIPTKGLVSHKFALKDILSAFETVQQGDEGVIKV